MARRRRQRVGRGRAVFEHLRPLRCPRLQIIPLVLQAAAAGLDQTRLWAARLELRPEMEKEAASKVQDTFGVKHDPESMRKAKEQLARFLGERWGHQPHQSVRVIIENSKHQPKKADNKERKHRER